MPPAPGCHNLMDPVGFALENFDAVGRWRDVGGRASRSTRPAACPTAAGSRAWRASSRRCSNRPELFVGTLTEKLLTFALGGASSTTTPRPSARSSATPARRTIASRR